MAGQIRAVGVRMRNLSGFAHRPTDPDQRRVRPVLVQAIRKTSSAIVPSVIREIEIWRIAVLMINRYADDAGANSFRRAEELRPKRESRRSAPKLAAEGDHAGAAIWRRITVAIEQLTHTTGPPN